MSSRNAGHGELSAGRRAEPVPRFRRKGRADDRLFDSRCLCASGDDFAYHGEGTLRTDLLGLFDEESDHRKNSVAGSRAGRFSVDDPASCAHLRRRRIASAQSRRKHNLFGPASQGQTDHYALRRDFAVGLLSCRRCREGVCGGGGQ